MSDKKTEPPLPLPDSNETDPIQARTKPSSHGLLSIIPLGPRAWKRWWIALVRSVSHKEILAKTEEDATFTFNYVFMVAIASGIATIGLLLNSPAVIIGAMLISPLMGPIVSTGFAIAGFDVDLGKLGVRTLLLGALAGVGFAAAITLLSPIRELTPEIISRTRPNLLDLAVAILSGAAGGYAMIRGRGGAIVGVAIATALMPPLAVVGYGLASWQWPVVRGALMLFITNMVAIALAVAAVAEWYGFGRGGLRKRFARQALISLLILAPLAVPLYFSLKGIAWESRVHATARTVLENGAMQLKNGQLAQVQVHFRDGEPPYVEAIVVSEESQPGLDDQLREKMQKALNEPVTLRLTQLHADDPTRLAASLVAEQSMTVAPMEEHNMAAVIHNEVPFPLAAVEANAERRTVILVPKNNADVGLGAWREIENRLAKRHADWHVTLVPPSIVFPAIEFVPNKDFLAPAAEQQLAVATWAIERWNVSNVTLVGRASYTTRGSQALSRRRLARVSQWFADQGITVQLHIGSKLPKHESADAAIPAVEVVIPTVQHSPQSGTKE
ncbi:MAG: TIGR00341 family protein [Georgfuchsia sp.]